MYESCILPILLYGCETWLLDTTSLKALEDFQCEIGKRILCLPKFHSKNVVRIALHWPSMATRILIRKLTFLAKLLSNTKDIISGRIFTSLAVVDVYNVSIVQQCRMLESELGTHTLASCLENPPEATITVKSAKATILKADFDALLSITHQPNTLQLWPLKHHGAACGILPLSMVFEAQEGCNCSSRSSAEDLLTVSHADPVVEI